MALKHPKESIPSQRRRSPLKLWIGVPFALFLALLVILTQIDLETVKEELVQRISKETGLTVEIDSMGFGFSRGLGLQCKGIKVSTPEGHRFSVNRLHLLAEWRPLLQGELKIKSAALDHPEITLEISAPVEPPAIKEKSKEKPQAELIDPETIHSATSKLKNTQLSIDQFIVSDGKITLVRSGTTNQLSFNVDATLVMNQGERLDISAQSVKVQTGLLIFEGDAMASNLTAENATISLNMKSKGFSWEALQPILQFFSTTKNEIPLKAVDVEQLFIQAEMPVNALSRMDTLQQQMTGQIEIKTRNAVLSIGDKNISIDSLKGEGTWDKGVLAHNFSGTALGSDFTFNGKLPFSDLEKDSTSHIKWKNLSMVKLPFQKGMDWQPTQGKVSGSLSLKGPLLSAQEKFPGRMNGTLEFQAEGLVLKSAKLNDPVELSRLQGRGNFNRGLLKHEIKGMLWGSEFDIKGKFPLNQNKPILNSQINWKGLDIAQLPFPATPGWHPIAGTLSGDLTVSGPVPAEGESFSGKLKGSFNAQNLQLQNKESQNITLNYLEGSGDIENHQVNYKLKGNTFSGAFQSEGRVVLSASGSRAPVLNNQIKFTNLDLSQLPTAEKPDRGSLSGHIQINGPLSGTESILTGKLKIESTFKVTDLKMSDPLLEIQNLEGKGILKNSKLTHDLKGNLLGGKISTKGIFVFQKFKEKTLITANSNLSLKQVSLDWVPRIYKSEWAPTSGTVTGNLNIKGPLPSNGKISPALKLKGILQANKLVSGNKQIERAKLEFKESSSALTQMQVELEKIRLGEQRFKKMMGLFQITPKKIDLAGGRIWPLNGLIQLAGNLTPESGVYNLKFKGDKLKVEEFLSPHLIGPLQLSGILGGTLQQNTNTPGVLDYSRDLSGNIKLKLVNGSLPELGALEQFFTLLNPISALDSTDKGLGYDYLGGDFKITKGVVHTRNLEMKGPQIMLNVEGQADLVLDTVNAQVKAMPLQMLDKTLKAIPLLGQLLTGGKKGGLIETYFRVDGKLSKPNFTMQPHKSLLEKPGSILKELLKLKQN